MTVELLEANKITAKQIKIVVNRLQPNKEHSRLKLNIDREETTTGSYRMVSK